jgi:Uma2 family endonuclease
MALSFRHENRKKLLGRFVDAMTLELNIPIQPGGSMTFKNELLERGLEPDDCYWIANEPWMRKKTDFDILRDPPPDLAIEIEVTRSALDRLGIYAALRIPEVWRFDGKKLRVCILGANGKYKEKQTSKAFPYLPLQELERFLLDTEAPNHTALIRSFHEWVKETLVPQAAEQKRGKGAKKNGTKQPAKEE